MKIQENANAGEEYKKAVEQIGLSSSEKEALLHAVLQEKQEGEHAADRRGGNRRGGRPLLPVFAGGTAVAAMLVFLLIWQGTLRGAWWGSDERHFAAPNGSAVKEGADMADASQDVSDTASSSEGMDAQTENSVSNEKNSATEGEQVSEGEDAPEEFSSDRMEEAGSVPADRTDGMQEDNIKNGSHSYRENSGFQIIAFAGDIYSYDKGKKDEGEKGTEGKDKIVLEKGRSYYTFSDTAPGCSVALKAKKGSNYDSYVVRGYGCSFVKQEGEAAADRVVVPDDSSFYMQMKKKYCESGLSSEEMPETSSQWQDSDIMTVAYIVVEAMQEGAVAESQLVYIGRKGNNYYGMIR